MRACQCASTMHRAVRGPWHAGCGGPLCGIVHAFLCIIFTSRRHGQLHGDCLRFGFLQAPRQSHRHAHKAPRRRRPQAPQRRPAPPRPDPAPHHSLSVQRYILTSAHPQPEGGGCHLVSRGPQWEGVGVGVHVVSAGGGVGVLGGTDRIAGIPRLPLRGRWLRQVMFHCLQAIVPGALPHFSHRMRCSPSFIGSLVCGLGGCTCLLGGRVGSCLLALRCRKAPSAGGACCFCSALHLTRSSTLRMPFAVPCGQRAYTQRPRRNTAEGISAC